VATLPKPVGVVFSQKEGGPVFIESVVPGGNADKAGIKVGRQAGRCTPRLLTRRPDASAFATTLGTRAARCKGHQAGERQTLRSRPAVGHHSSNCALHGAGAPTKPGPSPFVRFAHPAAPPTISLSPQTHSSPGTFSTAAAPSPSRWALYSAATPALPLQLGPCRAAACWLAGHTPERPLPTDTPVVASLRHASRAGPAFSSLSFQPTCSSPAARDPLCSNRLARRAGMRGWGMATGPMTTGR
jgi:hypothetical protein